MYSNIGTCSYCTLLKNTVLRYDGQRVLHMPPCRNAYVTAPFQRMGVRRNVHVATQYLHLEDSCNAPVCSEAKLAARLLRLRRLFNRFAPRHRFCLRIRAVCKRWRRRERPRWRQRWGRRWRWWTSCSAIGFFWTSADGNGFNPFA